MAPTLDEVKEWLGPAASAVTDEQLQIIIDGEVAIQSRVCRLSTGADVGELPAALHQAVLRRVAIHLARKGLLQGVVGDYEMNPLRLSRWDAEVDRLEASYRIPVVA